jgi:hypothetical protein
MVDAKTLDKKNVAAVCGNEMIVFGPQESGQGRRQRLQTVTFNNYGQALAAGVQFDLDEKLKEERKQRSRQNG